MSSVEDIINRKFDESLKPVFGDYTGIKDYDDLFCLADKTDKNQLRPRAYMCIGTEVFYDENLKLREKFETLNYDFTYVESRGTHNWEFWDEYIKYVLNWMFSWTIF